jgi:hypothetical protein
MPCEKAGLFREPGYSKKIPTEMNERRVDLGKCSLQTDDDLIVQLHIHPDCIVEPDEVTEIFETIHRKFPKTKGLLVTAGNQATLSQEARDQVSSGDITDQIIADAIVVEHYQHHMTANFFVRYNKPSRPTKIFRTEEEARSWLLEQVKD